MAAEQAADELDARRKAVAEREAISRDPKVIAAVRELTEFVTDVRFTPCNQETVERAESLVSRVRAGNLEGWQDERDAISNSIFESVYAGELVATEIELQAKREISNFWKPKPSEPEPSSSDGTFTLADLQRNTEMKRQSAESQPAESQSTSDADDDWGIDAAFDDLIAQVRALGTRNEPKGETTNGE